MALRALRCRWLLPLFVSTSLVTVPVAADDNPGSTEHIKDIFIGRCYDYKQIRYKSVLPQVSGSCEDLYAKFFSAFSHRPPCALHPDSYQPFMQAASQTLPTDKVMFWSGVKELVHEYASEGERYITLEDTLIGYVVEGMVWCGQSTAPGINYTRCPSWGDCPSEAGEAFWASASKTFAQSASGQVSAMMDVSRADRPAYRRDSFFGKYELPNLNKSVVTGLNVLLTHPLDSPGHENCESGSLVLLEQDVTALGFAFTCVDDPDVILHLLCVDNPSNKACHLASRYILPGPYHSSDAYDNGQQLPVFNSKPFNRFYSYKTADGNN